MTTLCSTFIFVSFLAAPTSSPAPSALSSRGVATPANTSEQCTRSLEFADFNGYDVIANQQLHRSEITDAQFHCFIGQLIRTRDRRTRSHFVGRLQNKLWEAVRAELVRLRRNTRLSAELRNRIKDLLAFDFADSVLRGSGYVRYNFRWDRVVDRDSGQRTVYRYSLHEVLGSGRLSINLPFSRWRFKSSTSLAASYLWGATAERQQGAVGTNTSSRQTQSYPSLIATSNLSLMERSGLFSVALAADVRRYWEPLADRLASRAQVTGSMELRKPWSTGLGARVVGSWRADRFAPPLAAALNRQQIDRTSSNSELSYHFGRVGIIGKHAFVDHETTTAFDVTIARSNTPTLLGHLRFKGGYFRFGGGGGVWRESFAQRDDLAPSITKGASGHGRLELQWQPVKWLSGNVITVVSANHSEGDFNGWYPSWSSTIKLMFSTPKVSAQAMAGWAGHYRDLDHRQDKRVGWVWAEGMVHTTDRWNLRVVVWGGRTQQTRFQEYDESWWGGSFVAGVRLLRRPELWLQASGSCSGYRYLENTLTRDQIKTSAAVNTTGRF